MNLDDLMKSAAPMQEAMKKADADRAKTQFEGSAGGGAVKVRLTGGLTVTGVTIAPAAAAAAGGDVSMLEDLVCAALGDALRQYRTRYGSNAQEQFEKLMAGADLMSLMGGMLGRLGK
jgi:hypothetical protein